MRRIALGAIVGFSVTAISFSGCAPPPPPTPPPVRFVHAVTPTLVGPDDTASAGAAAGERALSDLLNWFSAAPPSGPGAEFLVLTGDFGIGRLTPPALPGAAPPPPTNPTGAPAPTEQKTAPAGQEAAIAQIERVFQGAPNNVLVYVVPGSVQASGNVSDGLTRAQTILAAVSERLKSRITFRDLSACYAPKSALPCDTIVPGTNVRLVGYPGYAARAPGADGTLGSATQPTTTTQSDWIKRLEAALPTSDARLKTIFVSPLRLPLRSNWATDAQAQTVAKLLGPRAVSVIAIHGSGATRLVYERQGWPIIAGPSATAGELPELERRALTAPPLLVPNATMAGQPQGASLISVGAQDVVPTIYWYDPSAAPFARTANGRGPEKPGEPSAPDTDHRHAAREPGSCDWGSFIACAPLKLWRLGHEVLPTQARAVLMAISLLAAFLTAVAIWSSPPAPSDIAPRGSTANPATGNSATTATTSEQLRETFLGTRLGRTVISGLAGLAAVKLAVSSTLFTVASGTDATKGDANAAGYYIVWFVLFFGLFLLLSSLLRGFLEVWRASIFVSLPLPGRGATSGSDSDKARQDEARADARQGRMRRRRASLLTFGDTFFSVLQGKNDLQPVLWSMTITQLHESLVLAADRIRESIRAAVVEAVEAKEKGPGSDDIRVAISVLSEDGKRVYYISWPADSLNKEFATNSIAWVVVAGGHARWWKQPDANNKTYGDDAVLFSTADGTLPDVQPPLIMKNYYQVRDADYKAFVVLPVPFRRRGETGGRGGIHISFKEGKYLDAVFPTLKLDDAPLYKDAASLLDSAAPPVNAVLSQGIKVLTELLRDFNETVFIRDIRPKRRI